MPGGPATREMDPALGFRISLGFRVSEFGFRCLAPAKNGETRVILSKMGHFEGKTGRPFLKVMYPFSRRTPKNSGRTSKNRKGPPLFPDGRASGKKARPKTKRGASPGPGERSNRRAGRRFEREAAPLFAVRRSPGKNARSASGAGVSPAGSAGVPPAGNKTSGRDARMTRRRDACATIYGLVSLGGFADLEADEAADVISSPSCLATVATCSLTEISEFFFTKP